MTPRRPGARAALACLLAALGAAGAVGCGAAAGSDAGAPSHRAFCRALTSFEDQVSATDPGSDLPGYVRGLRAASADLRRVGLPGDAGEEVRAGFTTTLQRIDDLRDDASLEELAQVGDVTEDQQRGLDALDDYVTLTCPDLVDEPTETGPSSGE